MKKFNKEEVLAKKKHVEGSSVILAVEEKNPMDLLEMEITSQTQGVIAQLGGSAHEIMPELKVGQHVHFQRYGAVRVGIKDHTDCEHWVINAKDVLCIETKDEVK